MLDKAVPKISKPPKPTIASRQASTPRPGQYYQPPTISPRSLSVLSGMGILRPRAYQRPGTLPGAFTGSEPKMGMYQPSALNYKYVPNQVAQAPAQPFWSGLVSRIQSAAQGWDFGSGGASVGDIQAGLNAWQNR